MTIQELAERRAAAEARMQMLATMNAPTKWEDKIKSDAAYKLATDAFAAADRAYAQAIAKLTPEELLALSGA